MEKYITILLSSFFIFHFSFFTPAYAGHDPAVSCNTSYCDRNVVYTDACDGNHYPLEDCAQSGNICSEGKCDLPPKPATSTPSATLTDSTPSATVPESSEEKAINNLETGLLPEAIEGDPDIRPGIVKAVTDFLDKFRIFLDRFMNFTSDSHDLKFSELPENEEKPKNFIDIISAFLGDKEIKGIYNTATPEDQPLPQGIDVKIGNQSIPGTKDSNEIEQGFEDAYLPEGCDIITTGACNP